MLMLTAGQGFGALSSSVPRTYAANNATLACNDLFSSKFGECCLLEDCQRRIGLQLPDKWFGGYVVVYSLYVSAQNLYTFTGYHGYNVDYAGGTFTQVTTSALPKCRHSCVVSTSHSNSL